MKDEVKQKLESLPEITKQNDFYSSVESIASEGEVDALMIKSRELNVFQKYDVLSTIFNKIQIENINELLNLLEHEAKSVLGREEATTHLKYKKRLVDKISSLLDTNIFMDVNLIDEEKLIDVIKVLRKEIKS
jgi:hypothetical protein